MDTDELVTQALSYLNAGRPLQLNELAADVPADDTRTVTLRMQYPDLALQPGQPISVGFEDFYVWSYDQNAGTAVCRPKMGGSPRLAHSTGDVVNVNLRWTPWEMVGHLNRIVNRVSGWLWEPLECEFTWDGSREQWDLPFTRKVRRLLEVRAETARSWEWWALDPEEYRLVADAPPTTDYPSGQALSLFAFHLLVPGRKVRAIGAADLQQFAYTSTDVAADTGLAESALDILSVGAAEHVAVLEEGRRNQLHMQGDTRRGAEVPMTAWSATARELRRRYDERLGEERAKLLARYPDRR